MSTTTDLDTLRKKEYDLQMAAAKLRRQVFEQADPAASPPLLEELRKAEKDLAQVEKLRADAQAADASNNGTIINRQTDSLLLGPETTGLDPRLQLRMSQIPTAIYHLLDPQTDPLVTCFLNNVSTRTRRIRITSYIDGYSSRAVDTIELEAFARHEFRQSPTLFPHRIRNVTELTRATINVKLEDLDGDPGGTSRAIWTEVHKTYPVWLLARTTAPLAVIDPMTGKPRDMTRYFGAFVTPNAPSLMSFLRNAADAHKDKRLVGYQGDKDGVRSQVNALYDALKNTGKITYVNSLIAFTPEEGLSTQRVRLPRESLRDGQANCIDGTVLFASLLEGVSLNPAIVVVPGHAFVDWQTWKDESSEWEYLETTMIGTHDFDAARRSGTSTASFFQGLAKETDNENKFRRWSLRDLRATHRITPME